MTDWATISSLATAGGTLILAVATFYSVTSARRVARTTEQALLVGLRPVLFPARSEGPAQKIRWGDDHWAALDGGRAVLEERGGVIYLAMSLRNVGSGIAVLHSWRIEPDGRPLTGPNALHARDQMARPDVDAFRPQGIDIYVPPGDSGYWLAAIRTPDDPDRQGALDTITGHGRLWVDLLYGDHEGGQRTISRFAISQHPAKETEWLCGVIRHWSLDRPDPR